ncbi:MAG: hypothetical protein HC855_06715 [Rhizobiales bacterium]|nr:hypothetical protein [Hyphomicrobiales bacterium]
MTRAFDTECPRGSLKRFYPGITEVIDLSNVAHQMKVLDTLETANVPVTVVDLKAGNLSYALDIFERIGVLEAVRGGAFNLGLFHVIGPSIASLDEIGEIAKYLPGVHYVLARNFINETNFFEWDQVTHRKYFAQINKAQEIDIPKLNEMAYEQVDVAGVTYRDFIENRAADGAPAKILLRAARLCAQMVRGDRRRDGAGETTAGTRGGRQDGQGGRRGLSGGLARLGTKPAANSIGRPCGVRRSSSSFARSGRAAASRCWRGCWSTISCSTGTIPSLSMQVTAATRCGHTFRGGRRRWTTARRWAA